jgi:hypothetical protein
MWQLGAIILFLIYVFMPVVISSEIGQFDALRGGHLMTGHEYLPITYVHSDLPIPALEEFKDENNNSSSFVYGPLVLVYSDANNYFLSEAINGLTFLYDQNPRVYYLPRLSNNNIILVVKSTEDILKDALINALQYIVPKKTPTPTP